MKRLVLLLLLLSGGHAFAQSSPGWPLGFVPTAAQWNAAFASKQDFVGGATSFSSITVSGAATIGGATTIGGALTVVGATTITGTLNADVVFTGPPVLNCASIVPPATGNCLAGYQTGAAITTGAEITAFGSYAGTKLTTGGFNTAIGHRAMGFETTGTGNFAGGVDAMRNTHGISQSVAVGNNAIRGWICSFCTGIGQGALQGNEDGASSTGGANIAIGTLSMNGPVATTAANNIAIGNNIAQNVTSADSNVMIGNGAGSAVTGNLQSVMIGNSSGAALTSNFENTFVGFQSGQSATSNSSTYIGWQAGKRATSGGSNVAIGKGAGSQLTTGANNLILGPNVASTTLATGSGNILIGVTSATDAATSSTIDTLKIQGNGATPAISATNLSTTPRVTLSLVTSCAGVATGVLWNDTGTVKVCP